MNSSPSQSDADGRAPRASDGALPAAHGVIYESIVGAVSAVAGYALHVVAARWLGASPYGRFVLVLSILFWSKNVQRNILLPGLIKSVSEDHRRLDGALHVATRWYALAAGILLVSLLGLAGAFGFIWGDWALAGVLVVGACEIPFAATHKLASGLLTCMRRYGRSSAIRGLYTVFRAGIGCLLIVLGFGAVGGVAGQLVGAAGAAVLGFTLLRGVRKRLESVPYPQMFSRALSWTGYTLPFTFALSSLLALDLWMVGGMMESDTAAGYYGAAYSLARAPRLFAAALAAAIFPRVSGALADGNESLARSVSVDALRTVIIIFVPTCVLVGESSTGIVTFLFSDTYEAAGWPLMFLIAAGALETTLLVLLAMLAALDRPGKRLAVVAGMLPVATGMNWLLIPQYGLVGAAGGTLLTMAGGAMVAFRLVREMMGIRLPLATCVRCGIAGLLIGIGAFYWPASDWMVAVKLAVLGSGYLTLLLILGELGRREIEMVADILPGKWPDRLLWFWDE